MTIKQEITTKQEILEQIKILQEKADSLPDDNNKTEKWKPKDGKYLIDNTGTINPSCHYWNENSKNFGTVFQTKEQAEQASKIMRKHNLLLNWVIEHCGDGVTGNFYVTNRSVVYDVGTEYVFYKDLSKIYMSKQLAEKLAQGLNEGTIDFDNVE